MQEWSGKVSIKTLDIDADMAEDKGFLSVSQEKAHAVAVTWKADCKLFA